MNMELLHILRFGDDPLITAFVDRVPVQFVGGDLLQFEDQLSNTSDSGDNLLGVLGGSQEYCRGKFIEFTDSQCQLIKRILKMKY